MQRVTIAQFGYWDQYPVDLPTYDALHEVRNGTLIGDAEEQEPLGVLGAQRREMPDDA